MERLRSLLVQNQSHLGKLRARAIYCAHAIKDVEYDSHKQYGPFAGYWDEWVIQAEEMRADLCDSISGTHVFLAELLEFILTIEDKKRLTKSDNAYIEEVVSLASGKLSEQKELLYSIDQQLLLHKDLMKKITLVETIDSLGDES